MKKTDDLPVLWRWNGHVGHPRAFGGMLKATLDTQGFTTNDPADRKYYSEEQAALRDTAYFKTHVHAKKDFRLFKGWKLLALVFVCLIVVIVGWIILWLLMRKRRRLISIELAGEQYMASGKGAQAERAAVVSDVRLTLRAGSGHVQNEWALKTISSNDNILAEEVAAIVTKVEEELPKLTIPEVES